jgi:hypothetical protein
MLSHPKEVAELIEQAERIRLELSSNQESQQVAGNAEYCVSCVLGDPILFTLLKPNQAVFRRSCARPELAARVIRSTTSLGCDTIAAWLEGTVRTVALILLAMNSSAAGGTEPIK